MPNWCENDLTVTGPEADILDFASSVRSDDATTNDIDFNKVIPYPEEFAAKDREAAAHNTKLYAGELPAHSTWMPDGYNQGGYQWCVKNWGVKWNASDCTCPSGPVLSGAKSSVAYTFSTPWGSPRPVITAMAARWPALTFSIKYYECGAAFQGHFKIKGDRVLKDMTDVYHGNRGG